ncbi:hypothetical protein ACUNWD_19445 [Sunxiuqinia sp. A32]|uniref:hypothetical protein n=1 Tax=Sunxiuqinia sp. A32 TaxID=3461496 RepID=UPI004045889F
MDWYNTIENTTREQTANAREKDLRFFRIEEFLRMAKHINEFHSSCRECNTFKYEIEKQVDSIGQAVNHPGKVRRQYDRLLGKLSKHMQKKHEFYPPYHFTYLLGSIYPAVSSVAAYLISFLFPQISSWFFVIPAFVLGLLVGQLKGAKKDSDVRNRQKLL